MARFLCSASRIAVTAGTDRRTKKVFAMKTIVPSQGSYRRTGAGQQGGIAECPRGWRNDKLNLLPPQLPGGASHAPRRRRPACRLKRPLLLWRQGQILLGEIDRCAVLW